MNIDKINKIKLRIKEIEKEKEQLLAELKKLSLTEQYENLKLDFTPQEKINIFRSLFKGREDVFARRWENRQGKSGYSPVKTYSGEYFSITDEVIKYHLQGINPNEPLYYGQKRDYIIGIYPMLKNECCNFLTVDFDAKHSNSDWKSEIKVFIDTCKKLNIPANIEISRSGKGAHIWIFFETEITAINARRLGTLTLTLAQENNPNISFKTYDRMFPNQDTMPKGGFGNLIALPLQKKVRGENKTVFVNEEFIPYTNQWEYLSKIDKISELQVNSLLKAYKDIELKNKFYDENDGTPWKLPQKDNFTSIKLPEKIKIILGNRIYIEKENLPPKLINKFLKLAAFQNPEFYRAQAMRFSTYDKPRIIACGEILPKHIALPRGCLQELTEFLENVNIKTEIQDERLCGYKIKAIFKGKLKNEQNIAYKSIIKNDFGILSAPTAFGKTVLATKIISKRKVSTLILVHRKQLAEQWKEKIKEFLDIDCGIIGGGKNKPTDIVDIAIMQSLIKRDDIEEFLSNYGQLIVDECHHLAAYKFEQIAKFFRGKYILGLTATLERKDGHHPIIQMQCGEIVHKVKPAKKSFKNIIKTCFTDFDYIYTPQDLDINDLYQAIVDNENRNKQIVEDIINADKENRSCIILSERVEHIEKLANMLEGKITNLFVINGNMKNKDIKTILQKIKEIPQTENVIILSTGKYIGEGFDEARLDTLFLTMPISWKGTLTQYAGRLNRDYESKKDVVIYDYADIKVPVLEKMYKKRLKGYKLLHYELY